MKVTIAKATARIIPATVSDLFNFIVIFFID
jgi:hypothetical protein